MYFFFPSVVASLLACCTLVDLAAADVCTIPTPACASPAAPTTYVAEPCFPQTGVCYPTNYYAAYDQGQFSSANGPLDSQLAAKCRSLCDASAPCQSFAGVVNKAADSQLATGTCFLYSVKQIYPRQCANAPSIVIAYYKQGTCPATTTTTKSSTTTTKPTTTTTTKTSSTTTTTKPTTTTTTKTSSTTTTTKPTTTTTTKTSSTTTSTTTKPTTTSTTTTATTTKSTTTSSSTTSSSTTSSSTTSSSTTSSTTTSSSTTSSSTTSSSTTSSSTTSSSTTSSSTTTTTTAAATPACVPFVACLDYRQYNVQCNSQALGTQPIDVNSYDSNDECLQHCADVQCTLYNFDTDGVCATYADPNPANSGKVPLNGNYYGTYTGDC